MSKPTLGLCMIIKDEFEETTIAIAQLAGIVDEFYICCTGEQKLQLIDPNIHITPFKWIDDFAAARNSIKPTTDYWMWMDADDFIRNPERLPEVVAYMATAGVNMMSAKYIYKIDEKTGLPTEVQTRERIIKTSLPGKWYGKIHETWIPEASVNRELTEAVEWVHMKSEAGHNQSALRNRKILLKEWGGVDKPDPRIAHYLGLNYMTDGHFEEAIKCFEYLIEHGGWGEERYRAWLQIGTAYHLMGQFDNALQAYTQAILELPEWPDAYFCMQQIYWVRDENEKSLEWAKVGFSKPEPETESARNPIVNQYQPVKYAAYSELAVGRPAEAMKLLTNLRKNVPAYPIGPELEEAIQLAYDEHKAIQAAKELMNYNGRYEGDALAVLNSLPPVTRTHVDLTVERRELIPGKKWPKGSIVFWCGGSYEPWGPDTMDKGMGGSEEAIVQLARELGKITDREIVVYNERKKEAYDDFSNDLIVGDKHFVPDVVYWPWTDINPNDEFDVFIAWRNPRELANIKARLKICDLHDTMTPEFIYHWAEHVDKYMVKSQWHRNLYPDLPDDKFIVVGNGIVKEDFK